MNPINDCLSKVAERMSFVDVFLWNITTPRLQSRFISNHSIVVGVNK